MHERPLAPLEHRDHRFHLGPLAIERCGESDLHESAIVSRIRLARRSAVFRRDHRANPMLLVDSDVVYGELHATV